MEKVITMVIDKLKILSYLSSEFFDSLLKNEQDLTQQFGVDIGMLLQNHAELEQSFK